MEPPQLVLVPATPITPPEIDETAIVTIYSMYTDEPDIPKNAESFRKLPFLPSDSPPPSAPRPLPPINLTKPPDTNATPLTSIRSRSRSRSPNRPIPSPSRKSAFVNRGLPPVPMSSDLPHSRPTTPKSDHLQKTPPPAPTPSPSSPSVNATSSKVSLTPTTGEDPDAFLVRTTYAQLELQGVKGDGYEEGVERTRAKVNVAAEPEPTSKTRELSSKEIETLASLDRYGFFAVPSHDRLVLLPSASLVKRLSFSPTGPKTLTPLAPPTSLHTLPPVTLPRKETSRIDKWNRMILPSGRDVGGNVESWDIKSSKEKKLRERTYKGIPDRWRNAAWDLLMTRYSRIGKLEVVKLMNDYKEALEKPSAYDVQIDLDVPRTISGHVMFHTRYGAGQRALFHVLHSFSLRCSGCGYVQGMGPIAATLLCYFEPERVYVSMVRLHEAYDLHRLFSPGFPGLLEAIYLQERITQLMMPEVYAAFRKHMISTTSYATKWYITLFANSVPFQTQLRLWDIFLLEGPDVFVAVAVAIVWVYRDQITSGSANFETVLSLLSSFFVPEDEDLLLTWISKTLADKELRSRMASWREDWGGLVQRGEEGEVLL